VKVSAAISVYICAAFALLAFWGAWISLSSLERLTDAAERDMASGYGFFYLFLGGIAAAFGVLSWAISKGKFGFAEHPDE
jgi:hypothetical protein